jgi:2'-5' RNA ligase
VPHLGPGDLTTGRLGDRDVGCASAAFQLKVHAGYAPAPHDRADMAALCARFGLDAPPGYGPVDTLRAPRRRVRALVARRRVVRLPLTAVLVPVPAAGDAVALARAEGDHPAAGGMPPHVTVLYPFVPAPLLRDRHLGAVADLAATTDAFPLRLGTVGRFEDSLHVRPDPDASARLAALTDRLAAAFPAYPPYGGTIAGVVPHLTIHEGPAEPADLERRLRAMLPIETQATELVVLAQDGQRRWTVRARFALRAPDA